MPEVWVPTRLQTLTGGKKRVRVSGSTVRQVVHSLDEEFPGMLDVLISNGDMTPGIVAVVDGEVAYMGLLAQVGEDSEVHFMPAIGGG